METVEIIDEPCRRRFESSWRSGAAGRIEDFAPSPDEPRHLATLEELVHIDMEFQWKAWGRTVSDGLGRSSPPGLESYLGRFPQLNRPPILQRLAEQEFSVRLRNGDRTSFDEYRRRFPDADLSESSFVTLEMEAHGAVPLTANTQLGPYRIRRLLGVGGMGVVYAAEDPLLKRFVALKVMKPDIAADRAARRRFLREAQAAAAVIHDHIVPIYQVGEDREKLFLAMPLLEGETLDDRLKREGPLPIEDVARIGVEIAEGLAAAHDRGLIHRDVKPANIFLEQSRAGSAAGVSRVKILDFGLARAGECDLDVGTPASGLAAHSDTTTLTLSGAVLGTPAYMAPEQASGLAVDARADLFSLGGVLYCMCTGRKPYPGHDANAVLKALVRDQPPSPRDVNAAVPPALSDLIMRLLVKDPEGRPTSARAVADELAAACRPRRHWRALRVVAALVLAAVLAATAWFFRPKTPDGESRGEFLTDARLLATLPGIIWRVAFSPDGKRCYAACGDSRVGCWETDTGRLVFIAPHRGYVVNMGLAQDGKYLISTACDKTSTVRCWDALTGAELWSFDNPADSECWGLATSPKGDLVIGSVYKQAWLWDLKTGKTRKRIPVDSDALAFVPGADAFLAGGSHEFQWVPIGSDQPPRMFSASLGWVRRTVVSRDGRYAATGHGNSGNNVPRLPDDMSVRLWNVRTGQLIKRFGDFRHTVFGLSFTPDGQRLFAVSLDGSIHLFDLKKETEIWRKEGMTPLFDVAVSPDGRSALTGDQNGHVQLWRIKR